MRPDAQGFGDAEFVLKLDANHDVTYISIRDDGFYAALERQQDGSYQYTERTAAGTLVANHQPIGLKAALARLGQDMLSRNSGEFRIMQDIKAPSTVRRVESYLMEGDDCVAQFSQYVRALAAEGEAAPASLQLQGFIAQYRAASKDGITPQEYHDLEGLARRDEIAFFLPHNEDETSYADLVVETDTAHGSAPLRVKPQLVR